MKKLLHVIQHISFVVCALLLLQLIMFGSFNVKSFKGNSNYDISIGDAHTKFVESDIFNQMFGVSTYDVLSYGSLQYDYDNNEEYHNSVSANSIGGDIKPDLEKYGRLLDANNTNLNYYIIATFDDKETVFTNLKSNVDVKNYNKEILDNSGMYLFYDFKNDKFETNTRISESTVEKLVSNTGYYYANDIKLMIGLNKDLSSIDDAYKEASLRYTSYTDNVYLKIIFIVISAFIYLTIMIILLATEGVSKNKETNKRVIKTTALDKLSIEIRLILLFMIICIICGLAALFINNLSLIYKLYIDNLLELVILGAVLFLIISITINFFLYGFVRRLRAKLIYKTSYFKIFVEFISKCINDIYVNSNVFSKSVIPYAIILFINIIFIWFFAVTNIPIIPIVLLIIDICFGYLIYKSLKDRESIYTVLTNIAKQDINAKVDVSKLKGDNVKWANAVNSIGEAVNEAVLTSMKDEKMKADLITNVSHDLKTPLTSIINYVDLLKKENIDNERALEYINILDEKSQRLKQLTDDLVEASKISSGNVVLNMEKINLKELIIQATGEFVDKFEEKGLSFNGQGPDDPVYINADSRSIFRVIENLFNNICKYALNGTRVYLDIITDNNKAILTIKNISANPLNITPEELTERFIRGDESRTTEGSGLGLSIAKSLTEAMGGKFELNLDGDLFKVILTFDEIKE